jgi:hypothetical protein
MHIVVRCNSLFREIVVRPAVALSTQLYAVAGLEWTRSIMALATGKNEWF